MFSTICVDPYWFVTVQVMLGKGIAKTVQLMITKLPVSLETLLEYTMTAGGSDREDQMGRCRKRQMHASIPWITWQSESETRIKITAVSVIWMTIVRMRGLLQPERPEGGGAVNIILT